MYEMRDILTGFKNPQKLLLELNRVYHREIKSETGIKVMDEDWDNLIILDACRGDLFEETNTINGELGFAISSDSSTSGFLKYNFSNEEFPDTVYVSANPQTQRHEVGGQFHDCIRLWESDWNDELNTVTPETVTDSAIRTRERYPDKRLIVHYIQPHYPFIGETGRQINHRSITGDGIIGTDQEVHSVWDLLESGSLTQELVWEAYQENLELALPEVERLLENILGKSVITSDHGNSFGRYGVYGHPGGVFMKDLVRVPWLTIDSDTRPDIKEGTRDRKKQKVSESVAERLNDLGYK